MVTRKDDDMTEPTDLITWLRAQLDKDERGIREALATEEWGAEGDRMEVEIKQRIVNRLAPLADLSFVGSEFPPRNETELAAWTLAMLALLYAHREGYRDEWHPK